MKCFVTGANGFIGSNLVHELLSRGHRVKALVRPGSEEHSLLGQKIDRVTGDLSDRSLLEREIAGCDWCFHLAASYHLWMRNYAPMYAANVDGTRNVLEAAGRAGCAKIIYTSTVGCIGLPQASNGTIVPATEADVASEAQMTSHYKRSKFQAEAVAMELFRKKGLPIIIVNPSAPVGPGDVKPTPTGQIIVDFLNRRLPAYLETGLNWVHVRDVAIGHILAAERGKLGQRYILGQSATATGPWNKPLPRSKKSPACLRPSIKIPHWLAYRVAEVSEGIAFFTGKAPRATLAGVRMAKYKMWFNPGKAIRELGLPQTPPEQAFTEAVTWFKANGYVKK